MTPDEIPQKLIDILDKAAGKQHSRQGSVVKCLAEILTEYDLLSAPSFPEPCTEEIHSLELLTHDQIDSYYIRCSLNLPHEEHEDSNTGLRWRKL